MTNDAPSSTGDAPAPGEDPDPAPPTGDPGQGAGPTAESASSTAETTPAAASPGATPPAETEAPAIGTTPLAEAYSPPVETEASPDEITTSSVEAKVSESEAQPADAAASSTEVSIEPSSADDSPTAAVPLAEVPLDAAASPTDTAPTEELAVDPTPPAADATSAIEVDPAPPAEADTPSAEVAAPPVMASAPPTAEPDIDADTVIGTAPITVPAPDMISGIAPITVPVPDQPVPVAAGGAAASSAPVSRDRIGIHFAWEGVLLVVVALGVAGWVLFGPGELFTGVDDAGELVTAWAPVVLPLVLLATALGLSMRAGAVNLAVGHLALIAPMLYRYSPIEEVLVSVLAVTAVLVVAGLLLALVVTVFKAPAWAASLVLGIGAMWAFHFLPTQDATHELPTLTPMYSWIVLGATVVLSLLGGMLGLIRPIRQALGTCRAAADGTSRRSVGGFLLTWAALIGSTVLAGAAGVLAVIPQGQSIPELGALRSPVGSFADLTPLVAAMGIVLLGGTTVRGRRGGVFGTLLASVAVTMAWLLFIVIDLRAAADYGVPGAALLVGLLVNWIIEFANRPKRAVGSAPSASAVVAPGPIDVSIVPGLASVAGPAEVVVPKQAPAPPIEATRTPAVAETVATQPMPPAMPVEQNHYLYRPPAS